MSNNGWGLDGWGQFPWGNFGAIVSRKVKIFAIRITEHITNIIRTFGGQ